MGDPRYRQLPSEDKDIQEGARIFDVEIPALVERVLGVREVTLKNLYIFKKDIEESYDKSRKARIGGTTCTVTGAVIGIIGIGLSPVTFGASLGLSIAGGLLAAGGGVTITGAEIGYYVVSKEKLNAANTAYENDRELTEKLNKIGKRYEELLEVLAKRYNTTEEEVHANLRRIVNASRIAGDVWSVGRMAGRGVYNSYKLVDGCFEIGRTVKSSLALARAGQATARTAWAGMSTAVRVLGVGGAVLDVVLLPIDLAVMAKSAYDVHKYRTTGKSNSNRAQEVKDLIHKLEEHRDGLLSLKKDFN